MNIEEVSKRLREGMPSLATMAEALKRVGSAMGGPVPAGTTYNTSAGDGPEYFTPGVTGKITPSGPQWTKEPPTVPGWYWVRSAKMEQRIVLLHEIGGKIMFEGMPVSSRKLSWCGPISPPE